MLLAQPTAGARGTGTRHREGGDRICKKIWFLAAGEHKPRSLATVWGRSSIPGRARLPCRSSVRRFVSGRWKSRQIRPFPNPSQQDRQCSGERSRPCVFKQGHILFAPKDAVTDTISGATAPCRVAGMRRKGHPGEQDTGAAPGGATLPVPKLGPASGEDTKAGRQQRDEGRDGEKAEGAMSTLRTNGTTEDALPSMERDPRVWPHGGSAWQILCWSSLTQQWLPGTLISTN